MPSDHAGLTHPTAAIDTSTRRRDRAHTSAISHSLSLPPSLSLISLLSFMFLHMHDKSTT